MQTFSLKPRWGKTVSVSAGASVEVCETFVSVDFAVREKPCCFCQNKTQDGEAVWEDSCVEIFMYMFDKSARYANFEFNSAGVCYAARGKGRQDREEISKDEYAKIIRKPGGIQKDGEFLRWMLSVEIPRELLGLEHGDLQVFQVEGNLCKCADLADEPHWLTAFPINTDKPDFHAPKFFGNLNTPSWSRYEQE
jgi:hypothetical protein